MSLLVKRIGRILILLVIAIGMFGAGIAADVYFLSKIREGVRVIPIEGVINLENRKPEGVDFGIFWDAWRVIQGKYVDRKSLDAQKMVRGAIDGLIRSLDDPYSVFFNEEEKKKFDETIEGSFEGIGIEIGIRENALMIIAPIEGTPAKEAGLRAGDRILKIDEQSTDGLSVDEAVLKIRGPRGTVVRLLISREGWQEPKEFKITRALITIPTVSWKTIEPGVAYIAIYNFHEHMDEAFQQVASEVLRSGALRLIIDLRDNPGGLLDNAIWTAGWFVKRGAVVVKTDYGDGPVVCNECRARGTQVFQNYKIVILINEGTASAAEILAGALRDNLGTKLVGTKTFGKGTVQQIENLKGGSAIKLTIARWLTPNGMDISKKGIEPDIKIENPENDEEAEDLQLQKAIEIVKSL